jgi:hypothetical protein
MKLNGISWALVVAPCFFLACSSSETNADSGSGSDSGTPGIDAGLDAGVDSGPVYPSCNGSAQATVNVQFPFGDGGCPAFNACGGDPTGTWNYTGGCVVENLLSEAQGFCPNFVVNSSSGTVQGCVAFGGGYVYRDVNWQASIAFDLPQSCLTLPVVGTVTCGELPAIAKQYLGIAGLTCTVLDGGTTIPDSGANIPDGSVGIPDANSVVPDGSVMDSGAGAGSGGGCACSAAFGGTTQDLASYTISDGGTLATTPIDGGVATTYQYCVSGTDLGYNSTTAAAGAQLPGTYTLSH